MESPLKLLFYAALGMIPWEDYKAWITHQSWQAISTGAISDSNLGAVQYLTGPWRSSAKIRRPRTQGDRSRIASVERAEDWPACASGVDRDHLKRRAPCASA